MNQKRKGKSVASREHSVDSAICRLCPLRFAKPTPMPAVKSGVGKTSMAVDRSPVPAIGQTQQEDQEAFDEVETPADDDDSIFDDASFEETLAFDAIPQQNDQLSAILAAQRKFF